MQTAPADLLTEVMLMVFKINDQLLRHGDRKVAHLGLTSARWQLLSAIALSPLPRTAPQLARKLGVSRQGAQKQLNLLVEGRLVIQESNPRNARSPFYLLTARGRETCTNIQAIQLKWSQDLTQGLDPDQLDTARRLLKKLNRKLENEEGLA